MLFDARLGSLRRGEGHLNPLGSPPKLRRCCGKFTSKVRWQVSGPCSFLHVDHMSTSRLYPVVWHHASLTWTIR